MHNCKTTQTSLIDLVFEEVHPNERAKLQADLKSCPQCLAQYSALSETLHVVDRAFDLSTPAEDFWPAYNLRLTNRIGELAAYQFASSQATNQQERFAKLRRFILTPLRVPVPVATAFVLMFLFSTLLAIRSQQSTIVRTPARPVVPESVVTRTVNVPVIQEKLVTRVVYVERNRRRSRETSGMDRLKREDRNSTNGDAASSLAGFRPTNQVRLTVIKGNYRDEK